MTEESYESNHMFPRPAYYKAHSSPAGMGVAVSGGSDIKQLSETCSLDLMLYRPAQGTLNASVGESFILSVFSVAIKAWA